MTLRCVFSLYLSKVYCSRVHGLLLLLERVLVLYFFSNILQAELDVPQSERSALEVLMNARLQVSLPYLTPESKTAKQKLKNDIIGFLREREREKEIVNGKWLKGLLPEPVW